MKNFPKDALCQQITWSDLDPLYIDQLIVHGLNEDLNGTGLKNLPAQVGDPSSQIFPLSERGRATLIAREACVVCGLPLIPLILNKFGQDCRFQAHVSDGMQTAKGIALGIIEGPAQSLLQAERLLLNFLQYMSGIATLTQTYTEHLLPSETRLLDTRKTIPAYRMLSKYAFACGGGYNHRLGLFDRVMLKDNHLAIFKSSSQVAFKPIVSKLRIQYPKLPIQVEVDQLEQIPSALDANVDAILLDNFSHEELRKAVSLIGDQACTEASGGIELNQLDSLKTLGLDFVSTGAPIHQSQWVDIGLDWL